MNIGKAIKHFRKDTKWIRQAKLAENIKVHKSYVNKLEIKRVEFNIVTLMEICKALNIKLSELILKAEEYE